MTSWLSRKHLGFCWGCDGSLLGFALIVPGHMMRLFFPKGSMVSGGVEYLRKGINMDGFAAPNSRVFPFSEWPFQEPKFKIPYMSIYIYIYVIKYIYIYILRSICKGICSQNSLSATGTCGIAISALITVGGSVASGKWP